MAIQFSAWGFTLVTVGFVVEGASDKLLVQSATFQNWIKQEYQLVVAGEPIDTGGNGNMCSRLISTYVTLLKKQLNPDKIVVLADLDPEQCVPCITQRKLIIGNENIDLVVIARKAMEAWFLADSEAMQRWTKNPIFFEAAPEATTNMPWERLKQIGLSSMGRGTGPSKIAFARRFINEHHFDVRRAAQHPNCPSATYFINKLSLLANA